jgi:hypothetical protein
MGGRMSSKETYSANKDRVYEIYGIPPKEKKKFSIHHIIFRREGGTNEKSNLCPLPIEQHRQLHMKVDQEEGSIWTRIIYKHRRPKHHHPRRGR